MPRECSQPLGSETERLAQLIEERDVILDNLEIAETRYINSFALSTPVQSLNEHEDHSAGRKYNISRPRALMPYVRTGAYLFL